MRVFAAALGRGAYSRRLSQRQGCWTAGERAIGAQFIWL